ncbi:MAG: coproporphyrinogen III oxidase [Rhodospirillales bacterium]|nr:coproporphyrinogen III oxidase [Rhodospirillales bacterium]
MPVSAPDIAAASTAPEAGARDPGFGIYVHWPFCVSLCPYCDFNSHVAERVDHQRWRAALTTELAHFRDRTRDNVVTSVFFGGGTPSLMQPETVARVIDAVRTGWHSAPDLEITLEANPSSAEAAKFRALRDAGVNRLSLGVQSFDDAALRFLGRRHSAAEAKRAIAVAAENFPRFSFDLIYGLPGQTADDWKQQLREALELAGGHLSCYQLTIESGTPFHKGGVEAADEATGATLYDVTQEALSAAGLALYEISNHARPGHECRHNVSGWRGSNYLGVGPGAHSRLTEAGRAEASHRILKPQRWLAKVEATGHGTAKTMALSTQARIEELVMTGLRLSEGISRRRFARLTGRELEGVLDKGGLKRMTDGGFVASDDIGLRATPKGRLCLNAVLGQLLAQG